MRKTATRSETSAFARALPILDEETSRLASWPLTYGLRIQSDFLKATEAALSGWLQRRREGADAALEAMEKLIACRDPGEAISIHSEWFNGAVGRAALELQAMTQQALALSQWSGNGAPEAARGTAPDAASGAPEWGVRRRERAAGAAASPAAAPEARATAEAVWERR